MDTSHLGDRPLLLWSMALGMLGLAFTASLLGVHPGEGFSTAFFRLPFILGALGAAFVMGFVRPEMRFTWTVGMGGVPSLVLLAEAQIRIIFSPEHSAGEFWLLAVLLGLVVGVSLSFAGSSLGASAALRLSRY